MSYPVKVNLPDLIHGDGWEGVRFGPVQTGSEVEGFAVPTTPLERVELVFWLLDDETVQIRYDSDDAGALTITDTNGWVAELENVDGLPGPALGAPETKYRWAARFSSHGWGPRTLYEGRLDVKNVIPPPPTN